MPLGVCAAMWSIDSDYGLEAFGIVTAFVAVVTYIIVANLDNAVQAVRASYRAVENWLIKDMTRPDNDSYWISKGQAFKQFRPDRTNLAPSKWFMVCYLAFKMIRSGDILRRTAVGDEDLETASSSWREVGRAGSHQSEADLTSLGAATGYDTPRSGEREAIIGHDDIVSPSPLSKGKGVETATVAGPSHPGGFQPSPSGPAPPEIVEPGQ